MATLHPNPYPMPLDWRNSDHAMEALYADAASVDLNKSLVGAIVKFQVADGYAQYLVTKDSPLTLQHIPYADGYRVEPFTIRGLRKADIVEMLTREARMRELFSKKGT